MAPRKKTEDTAAEPAEISQAEPMIEIGEPVLPEVTIQDADIPEVETTTGEVSHTSRHTPKSFARSFVQVLNLGSMQATKATGLDMNMSEDEAEEMEQATQEFMESVGGVNLPPWAAFLMATGTFVGGRVAMYYMAQESKTINGEQNDDVL
ncbi:hypothetical protein NBRC116592_12920 [Colwellia sp. KU-HH00111]|uniref:hypothetical protein n=1 Tax=Colwellia sp. KU-HH00111 TaxID=3127652 RepID=UPI003108318D